MIIYRMSPIIYLPWVISRNITNHHPLNYPHISFDQPPSATWVNSITFPINTLCEIMGQPQIHGYLVRYTIHCLLPINLYNDKIFAVLTLFLGVVTLSNLISFGLWLYRCKASLDWWLKKCVMIFLNLLNPKDVVPSVLIMWKEVHFLINCPTESH